MDRGLALARESLAPVGRDATDLQAVDDTLQPHTNVTGEERETPCMVLRQQWQSSAAPLEQHVAKRMSSFAPGLLVGGEAADVPADHGDLERGCKGPKGHERRRHGRRQAGVRSVRQGPTLLLALDAQMHHDGPCTVDDLEPYGYARVPASQQEALERGKIMRQARSRKKRPILLADLEKRYINAP
jgi:hypothetical protein